MEQEYFKNLDVFGKTAFNATRELIELNGRIFEKVLERQLGVASLLVEGSEKQAELAREANDPQVFLQKQSELLEEYAGKFAEVAQEGAKLAQDSGESLKVWLEKGLETADKAGKAAVKNASRATVKKAA